MARRLILRSTVFRHVIDNRLCPLYNHLRSASLRTVISTPKTLDPSPLSKFSINSSLFTSAAISSPLLSNLAPFQHSWSLCSASDKSLPAVPYFTAVWCGPWRTDVGFRGGIGG